jgi:glycosyltransferase involved in cell wall biosynthesis
VLWRHGRELCDGRQCIRCVLHYRRPPQIWRHTGYLQKQIANVDAFIAMSDFSRKKHAEFGFAHPMEVVPYFLPPVPEPQPGSPHDRPYFLFVGRLERIKGLDDVIPLFRDYPNAGLLIAGDGEYGDTLRALAAGIPHVRFLGRLNQDELNRYYRNAIALIVPSICYETFGIILIEAFRQSTPVIARDIGPFPEIVESSGGGLLFRDSHGLLEAMARLQENPAARDEMGKMGYHGFLKYWSEEAVVPAFLRVLQRAAAGRSMKTLSETLTAELEVSS